MKKKTIGIILLLIILIIGSFFLYMEYMNYCDRENFNKTIKTVSDFENRTDINSIAFVDTSPVTLDEAVSFEKSFNENITIEINILNQYKNQTSNKTYQEYVDIEVNSLIYEKRSAELTLEICDLWKKAKTGELNPYDALSRVKEINNQSTEVNNKVNTEKINAINYLEKHPNLNKTLTDLGIDEDFNTYELDGGGPNISKFNIYY